MRLELLGAEAPAGLVVTFHEAAGGEIRWSVGNDSERPVAVERVALRWRVEADGPLRMFLHGWQSWSASGSGVVDVDEDPARQPTALGLFRAGLHADAAVPPAGELRSELVTVLADDADSVCIGFDGGARHDGTIRVPGDLVVAEAYLGGALLAAGERRDLHTVRVDVAGPDPAVSLDAWAQWAGRCSAARTQAPYQLGWGSWYHYFHGITEAALRENLAPAADSWPFDVFQLDDGYQAATGDWLVTNDKFPSGLERIAADVAARGLTPGLWLGPFLATPSSQVAQNHPGWFARHPAGHPVIGYVNAGWGGEAWVLDTTAPEVLDHLEGLGRTLAAMGWRYLKLDFTYAPTFDGQWRDPSPTPAQRVRAGFDAIRCGAGDDVFVLGCGAPLGACIGADRSGRGAALAARRRDGRVRLQVDPAGHPERLAQHPGPIVPAPPPVVERPRLPDAALHRHPDDSGADRGLGAGGRRLRRHGHGLRRPGPAGRQRPRPPRRGRQPGPEDRRRVAHRPAPSCPTSSPAGPPRRSWRPARPS